MPNKRNKTWMVTAGLIKGHVQTCKTNVVVSESCCSSDDSLWRDSGLLAKDTEYNADAVVCNVNLTEEDQSLCAENKSSTATINFAPIFLRTTQHIKGKGGRNARLCQSLDKRTLIQESVTTPYKHDLQVVNIQHRSSSPPHTFSQAERKRPTLSCLRVGLSASAKRGCLEEIRASNPAFPVKRVFAALQKKCSKSLQELASQEKNPNPNTPSLPQKSIGEKRKRQIERDISDKAPKHRRSSPAAEEASVLSHHTPSGQSTQGYTALPTKGQPRRSRLSRTHKLKQQKESGGLVNCCELKSSSTTHTDSESLPLITSESDHRDSNIEDGLWTEKYSPQHSSEVIGNSTSVKRLHSWLKKWKLRADCDERRKAWERKLEENSNDSWDCGDFQGEAGFEEEGGEQLCNTMLITGPPGVGKTASVYACAQELGFKVFEVNCSSQRNGRHVLTQLKEATQSHLVETSGKDPLKPAYLNNYNTNSCSTTADTLPGRTTSPKKVVSTSKRRPRKNLCSSVRNRKPSSATVTLANFFKFKAKADNIPYGDQSSEKLVSEISLGTDKTPAGQSKMMATSLILFEEVDIIFDDDVGFLTAIKTFMTITKRPVILTTNDPLFRERFGGNLEEIIFKTPSVVNVCSYLRLLCLAENVRTELGDVTSLLRVFQGDVRRCLLQLQLWVHSGGERAAQRAALPEDPAGPDVIEVEDGLVTQLPPRDGSCTASMLGLQSLPHQNLLSFLKCQCWTEPDMNTFIQALTESWRRGVSLLYSNLELLLPLPGRGLGTNPEAVTLSGLQSEPTPPYIQPQIQLDQVVDLTASTTNNLVRTFSRLSRRKSVSDSRSSPSVRLKDSYRTSLSLKKTHLRALSSNDKPKTEQNVAKQCLDALTDFTDLLSYLNATMPTGEPRIPGLCKSGEFIWTGAGISDGLLDEMREWDDGSCRQEMLLEIQAAVEGLGFQRCWRRVSEVWSEAQRGKQDLGDEKWDELVESLKLPVSASRKSFSFSLPSFCEPSVAQRRYELTRTVLCSRSFSLLGNRQAVHVDYMPILRSICRSEKAQQQGKTPGRFLSYLSSVHLGLSKSTIQVLAEDFP